MTKQYGEFARAKIRATLRQWSSRIEKSLSRDRAMLLRHRMPKGITATRKSSMVFTDYHSRDPFLHQHFAARTRRCDPEIASPRDFSASTSPLVLHVANYSAPPPSSINQPRPVRRLAGEIAAETRDVADAEKTRDEETGTVRAAFHARSITRFSPRSLPPFLPLPLPTYPPPAHPPALMLFIKLLINPRRRDRGPSRTDELSP